MFNNISQEGGDSIFALNMQVDTFLQNVGKDLLDYMEYNILEDSSLLVKVSSGKRNKMFKVLDLRGKTSCTMAVLEVIS
jgi:hypothetical protein